MFILNNYDPSTCFSNTGKDMCNETKTELYPLEGGTY